MENVHSTNHCWFVHEGEVVYDPRDSADLSADLDENFVDNGSDVLATRNGVTKDDLGRNWAFCKEKPLDVVVEGTFAFLSWN